MVECLVANENVASSSLVSRLRKTVASRGGCFFVNSMKIVIAPDSFKGCLSAAEAASAMAEGVRLACPDAEIVLLPLADGGEGTVEALVTATGGSYHASTVTGPLGIPVAAAWGLFGGPGKTAVLEMAAAAGLLLVPPDQRDPRRTTTYGVGELLLEVLHSGARRVIVGLGGSATNDGGAGALQALGVRFYDLEGTLVTEPLCGAMLANLSRINTSRLDPALRTVEIILASDVTNPLCGQSGASAVYGPQKGASPAMVAELDLALLHYAAVLERGTGTEVADKPGAGAAGGLGAGLMAVLGAECRSGIDLVLDAGGFEEKLQGADLVFTGEGRIDQQTLSGKTISGVLKRCRMAGSVPVIAFAGSVDADAPAALGLSAAIGISEGLPRDEAMRNAGRLLSESAARFVKTLLND